MDEAPPPRMAAILLAAAFSFDDISEEEALALASKAHPEAGPTELHRANRTAGEALATIAGMMKRNDTAGLAVVTGGLAEVDWIKRNSER
jgi:hypothetical protein